MRRVVAVFAALGALVAGCGSGVDRPLGRDRPQTMSAPTPRGVSDQVTGTDAYQVCRDSLRPATGPEPSRITEIRKRGKLKVGVSQTAYLMSYLDVTTGRIRGFEADIAREVAAAIFGRWGPQDDEPIEFVAVSTVDRLSAVRDQQVDMVLAVATMTCERRRDFDVDYSTEYYSAKQGVLVRSDRSGRGGIRGYGDLAGRRVCTGQGTTTAKKVQAARATAVGVTDLGDCLVLLQQGQVDAVCTDDAVLAGFVRQDPTTRLVEERVGDEPYGIVMAEYDTDLIRFVNGVLDRMRADGTWSRLYGNWLQSVLGTASPPRARYRD